MLNFKAWDQKLFLGNSVRILVKPFVNLGFSLGPKDSFRS